MKHGTPAKLIINSHFLTFKQTRMTNSSHCQSVSYCSHLYSRARSVCAPFFDHRYPTLLQVHATCLAKSNPKY